MGEASKRLTVEQTLKFIEKKATGKRSANAIKAGAPTTPTTNALDDEADQEDAVRSTYKRQGQGQERPQGRHTPVKPNKPQQTPMKPVDKGKPNTQKAQPATCTYCGRSGHGTASRRRQQCPAFGKTCQSCGRQNHYSQLCWQTTEVESAIHESVHDITEGVLPHQTWDQSSKSWIQRWSPPQPTLTVQVSTNRADYRQHNQTLRKEGSSPAVPALADTGCQSCLAGPHLMRHLGLEKRDLIKASLTMTSASGNRLPIIGAALTRIKLTQADRETRQMVYFSPIATKLYLSLSTCSDLGLIGSSFPTTPTLQDRQVVEVIKHRPATPNARPPQTTPTPSSPRPCNCPDRAPPPTAPTELPFPATEENRGKIEKYLLELYAASAFNICEHQPLPMMAGPPLALSIDPTAIPKPCHTPISVPVHWQEEVKRGLDRDVRL